MKRNYLIVGLLVMTQICVSQSVFINEIHYDNVGGDVNEGIEIAGPSGTDLNGWSLELYNGSNLQVYATINLTGTIPNLQNNRGTFWFSISNIQNDTEGFALIDPLNNLVQFLSYEGTFTAVDGVASGSLSIDIGVEESDTTTNLGHSLQLTGSGTKYHHFNWVVTANATVNFKNNSQTFLIAPAILMNTYIVSDLDYEVGLGPSTEGSFVIEGSNLTSNIIISAPTNFEVSITTGSGFSSSINLLKGIGTIISPTTVFVKLKSGLNIGIYIQDISVSSSGIVNKIIRLSGNVSPDSGSIIITEILQNPNAVTDANGEFFEVYNTTNSDIDMEGWIISDGGIDSHTITSSVIVPANGYLVFGRNSDFGTNGGLTVNYDYSGINLVNTNDAIILTSGVTEIDRVEYDDVNFPYAEGTSMELHLYKYDAVSNDVGSNWGMASSTYGDGDNGTPGASNGFGLSVVKNEIENFSMYPNPMLNEKLFMTSKNNGNMNVEIYSIIGELVLKAILKNESPLNLSILNRGVYLVRITEEGKIATRKLVVN